MTLVKVGPLYVNLDQATEIRDTGVDLEIFYQGSDKATTLRGSEAEQLRRWLSSHSDDVSDKP
jgi:hypothetical protein